ncbi:MAG: 50S ribosomal protein L21 [Flavobacteriales bacterium]|nr:50S ribosomal protein L21 [Flavobacteriales bacterium]
MYAIVEIAGQQFKVEKDQQVYVHRLEAKEGSKVEFDNVLLIDNGGKIAVGAPAIVGAKVTAKVLQHLKGDKVIVFKKKRRKGYKVKNGHREYLSHIQIEKIEEKGAKASASSTTAKAGVKTEAKPAAKAPAKPKAEPKKAATPKADASTSSATAKPKAEPKAKAAPKNETKKEDKSDK